MNDKDRKEIVSKHEKQNAKRKLHKKKRMKYNKRSKGRRKIRR